MPEIKMDDRAMLSLADQYEHGNRKGVVIVENVVEKYEDYKQRYATLVAEGLLIPYGPPVASAYQFTHAGYLKYSDRIKAVRALGPS